MILNYIAKAFQMCDFKVSSNLSKDKWFNKLLFLQVKLPRDKILQKPWKQLQKMGTLNTVFSEKIYEWVIFAFCVFI